MLERIDKIANDIRNFTTLLNESKSQLNVDNPTVKLIDDTIYSLEEFECIIQTTKNKVIYATQLQTSLLKTCEDPSNFTVSNINALKRMQQHSSNNLQSLLADLDKIQHELHHFKKKMEDFQDCQDIL